MKRKRIFRGVLSMGYGKAVQALIQLATVPALAASWGLHTYGQWLLLTTVPAFLAASDFGFGYAAGNRLIGEVARGDNHAARVTFQSAQAVIVGCSAGILTLALVVAALLPDRLLNTPGGMESGTARLVLVILATYGIIAMQSQLFMATMRAHGAFALSTSVEATIQLAEGLAVIAIALSGGTPIEAAFGYLGIRSLGVAGHVLLARRRAHWLAIGVRDVRRHRISQLTRPALAAMIMPLAQAGYLQGSVVAVGAAAGAAAVPIFTSLRTLSRVALQLILSLTMPILPEFTAEHERGNTPWLQRILGAMNTLNALVGLLAGLTLLALGNSLLKWWTHGAIAAPQMMITLTAAGLLAGAVWNPMSYFLLAVNRHEAFTYYLGVAATLMVFFTYVCVRRWGITGAAGSALILDIFMLACGIAQLKRLVGTVPFGISALRVLVPPRRSAT